MWNDEPCPACHGHGGTIYQGGRTVACPHCGGRGRVPASNASYYDEATKPYIVLCPYCLGGQSASCPNCTSVDSAGSGVNQDCPLCHGKGIVYCPTCLGAGFIDGVTGAPLLSAPGRS